MNNQVYSPNSTTPRQVEDGELVPVNANNLAENSSLVEMQGSDGQSNLVNYPIQLSK